MKKQIVKAETLLPTAISTTKRFASAIPFEDGENLLEIASDIVRELGNDVLSSVKITGVKRLRSRFHNRPGLVKISFQNVEQKINVLRRKFVLKDTVKYKRVWLKSDKTHADRLIELNTRALIRHLTNSNNFKVDANGRIRKRQSNEQTQESH